LAPALASGWARATDAVTGAASDPVSAPASAKWSEMVSVEPLAPAMEWAWAAVLAPMSAELSEKATGRTTASASGQGLGWDWVTASVVTWVLGLALTLALTKAGALAPESAWAKEREWARSTGRSSDEAWGRGSAPASG